LLHALEQELEILYVHGEDFGEGVSEFGELGLGQPTLVSFYSPWLIPNRAPARLELSHD